MKKNEFKQGLSFEQALPYLGDLQRYGDESFLKGLQDEDLIMALQKVDKKLGNLSSEAESDVDCLIRVSRISILRHMIQRIKGLKPEENAVMQRMLDSSLFYNPTGISDDGLQTMLFDTERFPVNGNIPEAMISYFRTFLFGELSRRMEEDK